MTIKKTKLVLCIDRDNDLFEKVKITGPIIGREANLQAAMKLGLADPEETDTNSMLQAIKIYDELSKDYKVEIATLTGSVQLGFAADKEISEQLERVLAQFPAESCIFVSDGASDEEIIPIIRSRLKIDSVKITVMKQAKELEKTYFVVLEKLKDPYYARIIFGVPAILILMFAISSYLNLGWQPVAFTVGLYLIAKGFGIEDAVSRFLSNFEFSVEKFSLIFYLMAFALLMISIWMGYEAYIKAAADQLSGAKLVAKTLQSFLLLPTLSILIIVVGRVMDLMNEKKKYEIPKFGLYAISIILLWLVFTVATDWVLNLAPPYVSFGDFLLVICVSVLIAFVSISLMRGVKIDVVSRMKIENKEVLSEAGAYVGKIVGVDRKNVLMFIQSPLGQKFPVGLDTIVSIGDKIVVRY
jgi:putative membrane protein